MIVPGCGRVQEGEGLCDPHLQMILSFLVFVVIFGPILYVLVVLGPREASKSCFDPRPVHVRLQPRDSG